MSIGLGFNMDGANAKAEWNAAFKNLPEKERPNFDKAYNGEAITATQVDTLFAHSANIREERLESLYGKEAWDKFKPNEKLGILDLDYNGGYSLIGRVKKKDAEGGTVYNETKFYQNMVAYAGSGTENLLHNPDFLNNALFEVKEKSLSSRERSDPKISEGMQNRRNVQAEMLNTNEQNLDNLKESTYSLPQTKQGVPHSENLKSPIAAKIDQMIAMVKDRSLNMSEVDGHADRSPDNKHGVQTASDVQYQAIASLAQNAETTRSV